MSVISECEQFGKLVYSLVSEQERIDNKKLKLKFAK